MRIKRVWVPTLTKTRVIAANEWCSVIELSASFPLHVRPLISRAPLEGGIRTARRKSIPPACPPPCPTTHAPSAWRARLPTSYPCLPCPPALPARPPTALPTYPRPPTRLPPPTHHARPPRLAACAPSHPPTQAPPARAGPRRAKWQHTPSHAKPRLFPFGLWAGWEGGGGAGGGARARAAPFGARMLGLVQGLGRPVLAREQDRARTGTNPHLFPNS
jgi:hypothetical protein